MPKLKHLEVHFSPSKDSIIFLVRDHCETDVGDAGYIYRMHVPAPKHRDVGGCAFLQRRANSCYSNDVDGFF